jgi:hypothetical protein
MVSVAYTAILDRDPQGATFSCLSRQLSMGLSGLFPYSFQEPS